MRKVNWAHLFIVLSTACIWGQDAKRATPQAQPRPDGDGVYYVGPQVTAPSLIRTVVAPYPDSVNRKELQGMTVLAMVIEPSGKPAHIQVLHSHGEVFDDAATSAVLHSVFSPGLLGEKPVPVWIDVRVIFRSDRGAAIPQVLITERDLPIPDGTQLEDKRHRPLSYTPPIPIHTVDADFVTPFVKHPFVQVATVTVLVSDEGLPKEVRVKRGLGFGLDAKAEAAVWHFRFFPATRNGQPISASREIMVEFAVF
jgi:TonB family protein